MRVTREDLKDRRALIVARHLCEFRRQIEAHHHLSEAKVATLAYKCARAVSDEIDEDDALIVARVEKERASHGQA